MKLLVSFVALAFLFPSLGHAETASQIMDQVIDGYFGDRNYSEFVKSEVKTRSWDKELSVWIDYSSNKALFVLGSGLSPSGTLFMPGDSLMSLDVWVNPKNRGVKSKFSGFDGKVNGTDNSYIDLARLIKLGKMKYEFVKSSKSIKIKATPQERVSGDYDFLIFYLTKDKRAVGGIEYLKRKRCIKTQIHKNIQWLSFGFGKQKVWRPKEVTIKFGSSSTNLKVISRAFHRKDSFTIDKAALEACQP